MPIQKTVSVLSFIRRTIGVKACRIVWTRTSQPKVPTPKLNIRNPPSGTTTPEHKKPTPRNARNTQQKIDGRPVLHPGQTLGTKRVEVLARTPRSSDPHKNHPQERQPRRTPKRHSPPPDKERVGATPSFVAFTPRPQNRPPKGTSRHTY